MSRMPRRLPMRVRMEPSTRTRAVPPKRALAWTLARVVARSLVRSRHSAHGGLRAIPKPASASLSGMSKPVRIARAVTALGIRRARDTRASLLSVTAAERASAALLTSVTAIAMRRTAARRESTRCRTAASADAPAPLLHTQRQCATIDRAHSRATRATTTRRARTTVDPSEPSPRVVEHVSLLP